LQSISRNLKNEGILCFDFIDASRFFKDINGGLNLEHRANFNGKHYLRNSYLETNTSNNFMFNWDSKYFELNKENAN